MCDHGKCNSCILYSDTEDCYCEGIPEKVNGIVDHCDYYLDEVLYTNDSETRYYHKKGFIAGFVWACDRHNKILRKYKKIVEVIKNDQNTNTNTV